MVKNSHLGFASQAFTLRASGTQIRNFNSNASGYQARWPATMVIDARD